MGRWKRKSLREGRRKKGDTTMVIRDYAAEKREGGGCVKHLIFH